MRVYKDDCVYSFDTPDSPGGIDVCLTCGLAFSPAPEHNFTAMHYRSAGHAVFVNITRNPKLPPRDKPKKVKVAIDAVTQDDLYETRTQIKDLSGAPVDEDKYADEVKKILQAESYAKAQEIQAWELEITPCAHVQSLEQGEAVQLSSETLAKCAQCELGTNLWLCLSCGTVSCGRPQFGGGGGNGHALEHFASASHPVAVKLGSITPDGGADVFCYADDEDVRDPDVAAHLHHWGINIAERTKTEKSMTELQLEQNQKWDFSMETSDGAQLEPVYGPGFTGMKNLGNTCYVNSVMQTLMAVPNFREMFPANDVDSAATARDPPNDLFVQLRKLQDGLYSGRYSVADPHSEADGNSGFQRGLAPQMLKYLLGQGHPEFSTMRQQDAYEFLAHFLTKLTDAARAAGVPDPARTLFGFESERRMQCSVCKSVKYKQDHQDSLSLSVPIVEDKAEASGYKPVTFDELMATYTAPEELEARCSICKQTRVLTSNVGLRSFPEIFVLNARRFQVVDWVPRKVDVPLRVPEDIVLDAYAVPATRPTEETLMPEDDDDGASAGDTFVPNESHLATLLSMGFDEADARAALRAVDNAGADPAMEVLFLPPEEKAARLAAAGGGGGGGAGAGAGAGANPADVATLASMGFTEKQARVALRQTGSVEAAVEWLFSGNAEAAEAADEDSTGTGAGAGATDAASEPLPWGDSTRPAKYRLRGVISHKGTSVHTGHYVAFIRNDDGQWYLFNDEKVVRGADAEEMQQYAYLYVFERVGR